MESFFRSERMSLCQLFIQPEAVYSTVAELGGLGIAQFKDLNEEVLSHQRKFTTEVRRIDEMERRLQAIHCELVKDEVEIREVEDEPHYPAYHEIIDLEAHIEKCDTKVTELSENFSQLLENQKGFVEFKCVMEQAELFMAHETPILSNDDLEENHQLHFVTGIVDVEKFSGFERMLWRVSHGCIYIKQAAIEAPFKDLKNEKEVFKTTFIAFFQGDQLKSKVKKVCEGYRATLFLCSNDAHERSEVVEGLTMRLSDLQTVINKTKEHCERVLNAAAQCYMEWSVKCKKLKAIYHTMNMFNMDVSQKCLIAECWTPSADVQLVQNALKNVSKKSSSTIAAIMHLIETKETPPTFHRTNKFTHGFQSLIDAYAVASYREANPALYTIVTFPFLFSVMFGDIGHGLILTLVGLWMVLWEKKLMKIKEEIFGMFFSGRYIILLMGLFSLYSGFIYNDIFGKSMNLFGTSWQINYNTSTVMENPKLQLNPASDDLMVDRTYPAGIDPVWQVADNKILFLNSFKMKLSIIFGIAHMVLGLCVSVTNKIEFRKRSAILLEFVPQVVFLLLLFGYLVFMGFFKWIRFSPKAEQPHSPGCAPSVLVYFINMMLFNENKALDGCEASMYPGQSTVQLAFVIIAVLCIPCMLLGKPLFIMFSRKRRMEMNSSFDQESVTAGFAVEQESEEEEESMNDVWTHQAIHTIEYVLGTVSHTASYLRLWALSLAHAQLSEVLWTKLMTISFLPVPFIGPLLTWYIFYAWAVLTLGILIVIEGLSAFLHTLRLHWVEFMDKFYDGNGHTFEPFSFQVILNGDNN